MVSHRATIGVVDAVAVFRIGLAALVEQSRWGRVIGQASEQRGCLALIEQRRPDIVVLDSGLVPQRQFIQTLTVGIGAPAVLVVVSSAVRNRHYLASVLAAGAHGVIARDAEPARWLDALRTIRRSTRYCDPDLRHATSLPHEPSRAPAATEATLSRRELQILQLIADGDDNATIARELFLSVETVRTHVKSILRKLRARDRTHAAALAYRSALLAEPLTSAP